MKLLPFAIAALVLAAPATQAANISSPAETFVLKTGKNSVGFNSEFSSASKGDTFADRFGFTLTGVATLNFTATSSAPRSNTGLDLTAFDLYNATTGSLVLAGTKDFVNMGGRNDKFSLAYTDLSAGDYFLQVSGSMLSSSATFAGNGVITVSPVPEPALPLMLLGGLAVLAVGARRKVK